MPQKPLKKNQFPYILGISLMTVAISASLLGFFAFQNLNKIIGSLEEEVAPNINLVIINNIGLELRNAESAMEQFVYSGEQEHLFEFKALISSSVAILDTLRNQDDSSETVIRLDSLKGLIIDKGMVLNQVAELDYSSTEESLTDLMEKLNTIETQRVVEDTVLRKKKGFIQKLFGKKEEIITSDTINIYASEEYQRLVDSQLDSIAKLSQQHAYKQKLREFTLQQGHREIQSKISSILIQMEQIELSRMRMRATAAKRIAERTNKYVSMFSLVIPILLLTTLSLLLVYIFKTKKYQQALDFSRRNALKLASEKQQFLANMSHEIRTPMNAIGGFAKILLKGDLNNQQKEYLEIIHKSTEHLSHIVNDVLDFSKLQSGKIKLAHKPFNPRKLIEETIKLLEDKAVEKNLKLAFEARDLPEYVIGDSFRLRQILLNLIYNGIKFTAKGGVHVSVSQGKGSSKEVQLIFEIMDTGIGIPSNQQKQIFNEFEQINNDDMRNGTGLGLSITKKLINIHKGYISLNSKVGKGSTFTVKLPYHLADKSVLKNTKTPEKEVQLTNMHILIADDAEFNRKLLIAILKEHDVTFDVAVNGQEAYELLKQKHYDVALLDFRMPKMDGPEVAQNIKSANGINCNSLMIGLTATVSDQDMEIAKKSGIQHVLRKPFDSNELLKLIVNDQPLRTIDQVTSSINPFNLSGLEKMGDETFVVDMVETFISSTKENLRQLDTYVTEENWKMAGEVLHKIIAPARHLKATEIVALLKKHEAQARTGIPIPEKALQKIRSTTLKLVESLQVHLQKNK